MAKSPRHLNPSNNHIRRNCHNTGADWIRPNLFYLNSKEIETPMKMTTLELL